MIIPALHRVLIKPDKFDEIDEDRKKAKALGLFLPESDKRADASVDKGKVVAIGSTAFQDFGTESPIAIGDYVAFAKFSGKHLSDNGEDFVILNDEDIVCIFKE